MNLNKKIRKEVIIFGISIILFFSSLFFNAPINSRQQWKENEENNSIKIANPDAPILWSYEIGSSISSLAISSDGNYIVAGDNDNKIHLFHKSSSTPLWSYTIGEVIKSLKISDEGDYIVVGGSNGIIYLFDKSSSTPLWTYEASYGIFSIAISSNGEYIVAGTYRNVILFHKSSSTPLWMYSTTVPIYSVDISSDGNYIVAGSGTSLYLFERSSSTPLWIYELSRRSAQNVAISSDGNYIVMRDLFINSYGGHSSQISLFHKSNSIPLWVYNTGAGDVNSIGISSDGSYITVGSTNGKIYHFHKSDSTPLWTYDTGYAIDAVSISSDGNYVVAGNRDDTLYFFHKSSSTAIWTFVTLDNIKSVDISANGDYLAAGTEGSGYLYLFSNTLPPSSFTLSSDADGLDPDGAFILSWDYSSLADSYSVYTSESYITEINENVILLEEGITYFTKPISGLSNGNYYYAVVAHNEYGTTMSNCIQVDIERADTPYILEWYTPMQGPVDTVGISSNGDYIIAGIDKANDLGNIFLFNKISSNPLWSSTGNPKTGNPNKVVTSEDGNYIAVGGSDGILYLFEKSSSTPLWSYDASYEILSIAISSNGEYIVVGSYSKLILFHRSSSTPLWIYSPGYYISTVDISSDGTYIVAGGGHNLHLFEKSSSTPIWIYAFTATWSFGPSKVAISSDGNYIAVNEKGCYGWGGGRSIIHLFHKSGPVPLWYCGVGYNIIATSIEISADGNYITVGSSDGRILLFHISDSTPLWTYGSGYAVDAVAFSSDGNYIVAGNRDGTVCFFHKSSSTPLWIFTTFDDVKSVDISANGDYIAAGTGGSGYLYLFSNTLPPSSFTLGSDAENPDSDGAFILSWDYSSLADSYSVYTSESYITEINENVILLEVGITDFTKSISRLSNGNYYYVVVAHNEYGTTMSNCIQVTIERADTPYLLEWYTPMPGPVDTVGISSNGDYITAGIDKANDIGNILLFNKISSNPLWSSTGNPKMGNPNKVVISEDGNYIAVGGSDGILYLFEKSSSTPIWTYEVSSEILSIAISSNGEYIVAGSYNKLILFHRSSSTPLWIYSPGYSISTLDISSDGTYIVAGGDHKLHLFEKSSSTPIWIYAFTATWIYGPLKIAISSDGNYIAVNENGRYAWGGVWSNIHLFHKSSPVPLWISRIGRYSSANSIEISADGNYITVGSSDGSIFLFHISDSAPLWVYGTGYAVDAVAISLDGNYIVAGNRDGTVYFFHKSSSTPLWTFTTYDDVKSVAISSNGDFIVAGTGYNGYVYLFSTLTYQDPIPDTKITGGPSGSINYNDITFRWMGVDDNTPLWNMQYSYYLESHDTDWSTWTSNTFKSYYNLPNGQYTFKVRAKDIDGNIDPTPAENSFIVIVQTENQPPIASIICPTEQAKSGEYIVFDASNSYDPEGGELQYYWDFGDGETANGCYVNYRFRGAQNQPEIYTVSLTVEDNYGLRDTKQTEINILPLIKSIEIVTKIPFEEVVNTRMTVYYNWVEDNTYMVTKISYQALYFLGVATLSIWDFHSHVVPIPVWAVDILTKEAVYFPVKDIYQHGWEIFEGILVDGFDAMNMYTIGWYKISMGTSPPFPAFKTVSACFMPDYYEEPEVHVDAPDSYLAKLFSPGELRIYDPEGRTTGLFNGVIINEIPNSFYIDNTVIILSSDHSEYYSEIEGIEDGKYALVLNSIISEENNKFIATDIPIHSNELHQYTIDWELLSQGEEGVVVDIDSNGDGTIEHSFTSDNDLNTAEYVVGTLTWPYEGDALQDGVVFELETFDNTVISGITVSIREPGEEDGIIISDEFENIPLIYEDEREIWGSINFDTTQLPDGYYVLFVQVCDAAEFTSTINFDFSIRNWAILELLPATRSNKPGRTMPMKFSLRVAESVDPSMPFVVNGELCIIIYDISDPSVILQESYFGDSSVDYRIDTQGELYITNFKTSKTPAIYVVEIWRKDMLIGSFTFSTMSEQSLLLWLTHYVIFFPQNIITMFFVVSISIVVMAPMKRLIRKKQNHYK